MAVHFASVCLIASAERCGLTENDFLLPLSVDYSDDAIIGASPGSETGETSFIVFFEADLKDYNPQRFFIPEESLLEEMLIRLGQVAKWMEQRRETLLEIGKELDLSMMIEFTITQSHLLFALPPEFLLECGKAEIKIETTIYPEGD